MCLRAPCPGRLQSIFCTDDGHLVCGTDGKISMKHEVIITRLVKDGVPYVSLAAPC